MTALPVDIWSDVVCPWCYVGKRRFEKALAQFPERGAVQVTWHSFELDPAAPRQSQDGTYSERLARKYGTSQKEAVAMISRLTDVARAEGLEFDFNHIRPGNTFDAHRLLHLAGAQGLQNELKEHFLYAYFCEGAPIGDADTLASLASEVGLIPDMIGEVLKSDRYSREVRQDEAHAAELGIRGVPFFVLGERFGVSGAQPTELHLEALEKASQSLAASAPEYSTGAACGPDGC